MSQFWSDTVRRLTPYVPGEQPKVQDLIKLNTNENPYGPSPKAIEALHAVADDSLRLYPDPESDSLKAAIARFYAIEPSQVFIGNGSDEVLAHIFQALLKHEQPILFPDITYSFYPVYCGLYGVDYEAVALNDDFEIDVTAYKRPNGGIIFPNPNAPTGRLLPVEHIQELATANPTSVVVVDEAYVDFGGESVIPWVSEHPNLLVTQTFSKARSLAGLRIGFAVGQAPLIEALERVKNSFNSYPLDRMAQAAGVAAMDDREHFDRTRGDIMDTRQWLSATLMDLGFRVVPSHANFVFARHPDHDAADLSGELRERRIIVRHFKLPRIDQFLRITIGTRQECEALVDALRTILAG
ncbi:MAG: histidinol-phosphate transaminase [Gammaproteobacteria bacterium]